MKTLKQKTLATRKLDKTELYASYHFGCALASVTRPNNRKGGRMVQRWLASPSFYRCNRDVFIKERREYKRLKEVQTKTIDFVGDSCLELTK